MYNPKFTITNSILDKITQIAEIKSIVERSRVLPKREIQLRRQAIIRMVHTSTSIEGNELAEFQVNRVLADESVKAEPKSIKEIKNYKDALILVEKIAGEAKDFNVSDILAIQHEVTKGILPPKKSGYFRPSTVYVVNTLHNIDKVMYRPPSAKKVPVAIFDLLTWLKKAAKEGLHPIIRAGILHLEFASIHPFTDGNGRTTRLLTQLHLLQGGWDFRKILVLDEYYNQDRLEYYNALQIDKTYRERIGKDITSWIEYFTEGFLVEALRVKADIQATGLDRITGEGEQIFLDKDEVAIAEFLAIVGRVTSEDVVDILKVAKRTAQLKLKKLVDKGFLNQKGAGNSYYYELRP
ncbi:MAG: Fic family protein [Candidatus Daviesbacteria bacterium]|nr:Fic family protein [Candidatus Daviesbacteria bacterium]